MTREHMIQTILRSELIQWHTFTRDQLINCLIMERRDVLDSLEDDYLTDMLSEVDIAEAWSTTL